MKQKAEITFEIEETITVKSRCKIVGFCEQCGATVQMLTVEVAAALSGLGEREIFRLIETSEIHFVEAERVFICPNSLIKRLEFLDD
jgi:hypothetical protein